MFRYLGIRQPSGYQQSSRYSPMSGTRWVFNTYIMNEEIRSLYRVREVKLGMHVSPLKIIYAAIMKDPSILRFEIWGHFACLCVYLTNSLVSGGFSRLSLPSTYNRVGMNTHCHVQFCVGLGDWKTGSYTFAPNALISGQSLQPWYINSLES